MKTLEQKRIAVAEFCKWPMESSAPAPRYDKDLNALREAVLMLPEELRLIYSDNCQNLIAEKMTCVYDPELWTYESLTCGQRFYCLCKTIGCL